MLVAEIDAAAATTADVQTLSIINFLYARFSSDALTALAPVALAASNDTTVSARNQALKAALLDARAIVGPFRSDMMEAAASWLDQGAKKVLVAADSSVDDAALEAVATAVSELPANRVVVRLPVATSDLVSDEATASQLLGTLQRLAAYASGFVLALEPAAASDTNDVDAAANGALTFELLTTALQLLRKALDARLFVAIEWASVSDAAPVDSAVLEARIATLHHLDVHVVAPASATTTIDDADDATGSQKPLDAGRAFVQCLRSDRPDGLFTTVVADEAGVALGLVYSSVASVLAAIASRRGVYYSRSRQGLWKKGESSGNAQTLVQLDVDCDSDALRFTVVQTGAGFCHLDTRTCWGDARGIQHLETMLTSRLASAPAGSYTKRLFSDPTLLRNKLVEEAQELAEAESVDDVAGEAADVLYFALVRCVAAGATVADVERVLDKRALKVTRRPGNAKAYRIDAAAAILHTNDSSKQV